MTIIDIGFYLSFFAAICLVIVSFYSWHKANRLGDSDMKWRKSLELTGCVSLVVSGVFIIVQVIFLKLGGNADLQAASKQIDLAIYSSFSAMLAFLLATLIQMRGVKNQSLMPLYRIRMAVVMFLLASISIAVMFALPVVTL